MITFNDIFKSSFLEKVSSFSPLDMFIALGMSFIIGLFIFMVYKKTFSGVMYSASFGISLVAMSMITTLTILAVTSNVVLSLGMVGALSIVRFRTAVKEPMDIAFLFWAISVGIVMGAGLIPLGVFGSVFIGIILVLFANKKSNDNPYILVINCSNDDAEKTVVAAIKNQVKNHLIKSKTVSENGIELAIEIRLKDNTAAFVNQIAALPGTKSAVLVSYNGEYMA